jgi:hypothetical protein
VELGRAQSFLVPPLRARVLARVAPFSPTASRHRCFLSCGALQEGARLQMDLNSRSERIDRKRQHLQDLVQQQISFKQLIARNQEQSASGAPPPPSESQIALPFIVVNTKKETVIDCEMAEDKQEIFFNFSAPFEIHDDSETLKRMHMQRCAPDRVDALVPSGLAQFAREMLVADAAAAPPSAPTRGNGRR